MPYNTNVIPPRKEATGQPALPLARVKKIIATDSDIGICSNNAAFVVTLATEMFIQYLANEGHNVAKMDRKPRRNVQYKDLAAAVNNHDNLEFLEDVIPKTIPYKNIKDQALVARTKPKKAGDSEPKKRQSANGVNGTILPLKVDLAVQPEASTSTVANDGDVDMTG